MNHKHLQFITSVIRHGDKEKAYAKAYPNAKSESCKSAASRLYNRPEIKQLIDEGRAKAAEKAYEKAREAGAETMAEEFLSLHEKRRELARIVRRQQRMTRCYKFKDHVEEIEVVVDNPTAILRAIELDTKLEAVSLRLAEQNAGKQAACKQSGNNNETHEIRFYEGKKSGNPKKYPDLTDEESAEQIKRSLTDPNIRVIPPRLFPVEEQAGCRVERDFETGEYKILCPEESREMLRQNEHIDLENITFINNNPTQTLDKQDIEQKNRMQVICNGITMYKDKK